MKVLVDHMNFLFISFHMTKKELRDKGIEEFTEEHVGFFYHTLFNKYNHLFKTYGQLIICHEGMDSLKWRRSIYPDYKRNRDEIKKDPSYFILKNKFSEIEEILSYYPCKQIKIDEAEADDVIFALAKYYGEQGEDVVIITTDGDLSQVMNYSDTISVYNPIKKTFIPKKEFLVEYKSIVGDRSDNIPGISRIGEKTFEKMLKDKKLWNEKLKGKNYEIYQKFLKIVDLSKFPKEIHEKIIQANNSIDYNIFNIEKIEQFFFKYAMQDHVFRWGNDYSDIMSKLNGFIDVLQLDNSNEELDDVLSEFI